MRHPLEPLNEDEINKAVAIFKSSEKGREGTIFSNIQLVEPSKESLSGTRAGEKHLRIVQIHGVVKDAAMGFLATLDIDREIVIGYQDLPLKGFPLHQDDTDLADSIVFNDPECLEVPN